MRRGTFCDVPLPADALTKLRLGPSGGNPRRPDLVELAQRIAGTIGFITNTTRPDAQFSYCVLARYVNEARLTQLAFDYLVRIGNYLDNTKHLSLHLTAPEVTPAGLNLFSIYADSSLGNAEDGLSYGGFVLLSDGRGGQPASAGTGGGGAFAWKCESPEEGDDSSAAAELRMLCRAAKYGTAARCIQRDLDIGIAPSLPTPLYTDANAVLGGRQSERMPKSSRWLAVRYAMLRWAERSRIVRLARVPSPGNCADIMTKCLTGPLFRRHRATVLGIPGTDPEDPDGDISGTRMVTPGGAGLLENGGN